MEILKCLNGARFLHTRGGVSDAIFFVASHDMFSPHTWRCFPVDN